MGPAPHGLPVQWPEELVHQSVRTSVSSQDEVTPQIAETVLNSKNVMISIGNASVLRRYYEKVFENLQQTNCRILAKVYVRLVEPRKQVKFPYNGRKNLGGITYQCSPDETRPPWWPLEVRHREPDHLYKVERIELLVHILCDLRASHGVTARRLRAADETIRRQICPTDRINLLDELYYVREKEEKLLDGNFNVNARVSISGDNVPNDLELTIFQNSTCARRSPHSQKSEEQRIPQDPLLLSGPIREVTHIALLNSGAPDSETTRYPHQTSFASPRSVPTSTSVFPSGFEYGNESQTSYLSTPGSVCMEHYFLSGLDYQSYLTDPSQVILPHRLEHPPTKAQSIIETNEESVDVDGFNQALEGSAWH
ncbi:uncharacterized protein N7446_005061 [Penicillium canescens]|uniref:Subtelomeric hrmA-associated cluster protein AFUB-079030/YDR124W-like helical bundle domain-containing protein n=1 Tax=Penicillium canescens TaxID=5083 RepID=A0AAD6N794_PENCN|nr:uncharacterized protein N7446_005061 [Penicillium canescens]KAJ6038251.1 hypothetical protein N7460_008022 [Penicillium canescens]KAJ6039629.1 hypothetical protein N7444_008534 [Penicillium canescens]KAJ6068024.1 hypothetical protein N7446_005061 [Penicillium canescens]